MPKDAGQESLEPIFDVIQRSMERRTKTLVLVAENEVRTADISHLLSGDDLEILHVSDLTSAAAIVNSRAVDAIVLDCVAEAPGVEFIESVQSRPALQVPAIVVSGSQKLSDEQVSEIHYCARVGPVRYAPTIERLLEETVLLLHREEERLSAEQRGVLAEIRQTDPMLVGRRVLVIDDDLRNIFALTSVLEQRELKTLHAENGRAGIELLQNTPDVDIVLMDIMMPEMDGYETMRAIRKIPAFQTLPIVALTAKAMKGDREKCLRAGASDYVTKPVDLDLLFSVMRVWMARDIDNRFEHGVVALPNWLEDHEARLDDDRNNIQSGDSVLLIVEDDPIFAGILMERARHQGLKALVALRGSSALTLARTFKPQAITLDVRLPDMSGWTVLDHLKHDSSTRHIPVHVLSLTETHADGFTIGATTCIQKTPDEKSLDLVLPAVARSMQAGTKRLLVLGGSEPMRKKIVTFLDASDLEFSEASSLDEALDIISTGSSGGKRLDGIVIDWAVSEVAGIEFVEKVQARFQPNVPPVITFGPAQLDPARAAALHRLSKISSIRYAPSLERLLDETVILLHRREENLSAVQKSVLANVRQIDPHLADRKVLIVDDDLRNIFALTSALEHHNVRVIHAETGRSGIDVLKQNPDTDLVLMDIMMPEMDGYETTRAIRKLPGIGGLPIIALTAKAMKGDREKCLQAGASDYVAKPVDLAYLFSVMRIWMAGLGVPSGLSSRTGSSQTTGARLL
jgi:CheY-like chemotaxis protein